MIDGNPRYKPGLVKSNLTLKPPTYFNLDPTVDSRLPSHEEHHSPV